MRSCQRALIGARCAQPSVAHSNYDEQQPDSTKPGEVHGTDRTDGVRHLVRVRTEHDHLHRVPYQDAIAAVHQTARAQFARIDRCPWGLASTITDGRLLASA